MTINNIDNELINKIAIKVKEAEIEYNKTAPRTEIVSEIPKCLLCKINCNYFQRYCVRCISRYNIPERSHTLSG